LFVLKVVASVSGLIFLSLLTDCLSTITSLLFASLCDRVRGFFWGKVIDKLANFLPITLFDNPDGLPLIKLTEKGLNSLE
jgi:ATP-binding cassette subfamily B protein